MQATGRPLFPGVELTSLDYLWALLNAAVLLAGAVSLWFLKEEAYMIFCGYFFLLAVGLLWNYFMRGYSSSVGFWAVGSGLIVPAIIYGYCYSLKEKGILR
jgi:hypothetical protein